MADNAEKKDEAAGEDAPKKKLPLWVIILIASQVVVLGGAIVAFKMMTSSAKHEEAAEEAPTEAENKVDPSKVTDAKTLVGPQFDMDPFIINLIDDGRGPKYLRVEVKLELEAEALKSELETRLSQVRDEMLTLMSSKRQTDIETADGKRILKDEIFTRVNKLLVTGRIKRVYFTEFVIQ